MPNKRNKQILFLPIPDSLVNRVAGSFRIDPAIPIPIEISEGFEKPNFEDLTIEMIISGMLIVIQEGKEEQEWIDYYRRFVLAVRPCIQNEFTNAAIVKARCGDYDLALEILAVLRGLFPASPTVMLNRALVLEEKAASLEQNEDAQSEKIFHVAGDAYAEALTVGHALPKIYFDAGFFYFGRKDFRKARECLSLFVESADPVDEAEKRKQALSIIRDMDNSNLHDEDFIAAYESVKQGQNAAGIEHIRKYLNKYPSAWNGWFILGWALRQMERWEDGARAIAQAIELGGNGSDLYNELAICLMESGDLKNARQHLEKALQNDSKNVKLISNMGILALKNNNHSEAAAFFRTVLELDPQDAIANTFFSG